MNLWVSKYIGVDDKAYGKIMEILGNNAKLVFMHRDKYGTIELIYKDYYGNVGQINLRKKFIRIEGYKSFVLKVDKEFWNNKYNLRRMIYKKLPYKE